MNTSTYNQNSYVTVYVWDAGSRKITSPGHVAMEMTDYHSYYSFYPKEDGDILHKTATQPRNYAEELKKKGNQKPSLVVRFYTLDQRGMQEKASQINQNKYSLIGTPNGPNCASLVYTILEDNGLSKLYGQTLSTQALSSMTPNKMHEVLVKAKQAELAELDKLVTLGELAPQARHWHYTQPECKCENDCICKKPADTPISYGSPMDQYLRVVLWLIGLSAVVDGAVDWGMHHQSSIEWSWMISVAIILGLYLLHRCIISIRPRILHDERRYWSTVLLVLLGVLTLWSVSAAIYTAVMHHRIPVSSGAIVERTVIGAVAALVGLMQLIHYYHRPNPQEFKSCTFTGQQVLGFFLSTGLIMIGISSVFQLDSLACTQPLHAAMCRYSLMSYGCFTLCLLLAIGLNYLTNDHRDLEETADPQPPLRLTE